MRTFLGLGLWSPLLLYVILTHGCLLRLSAIRFRFCQTWVIAWLQAQMKFQRERQRLCSESGSNILHKDASYIELRKCGHTRKITSFSLPKSDNFGVFFVRNDYRILDELHVISTQTCLKINSHLKFDTYVHTYLVQGSVNDLH